MPARKTRPFGAKRWVVTKARYVRMLAPFVSNDPTRVYLSGIHVEACGDGIILAAADGHRMGIIRDAHGMTRGTWVNPVSKEFLARACEMGDGAVAVFCGLASFLVPGECAGKIRGPKTAERHQTFGERNDPIDGTFLDWRKVVPRKVVNRHRPMTVNGRYVADFIKVARAAGVLTNKGGAGFLFFQTGGEADPLFVRHAGMPEFCGIQMPMRGADIEPIPDWLLAA